MSKKPRPKGLRDCDECAGILDGILRRYNCTIKYDEDFKFVVVVDQDTSEFVEVK